MGGWIAHMKKTYLIGIDLGTQGTKTAIYDADGSLVADAFEPSMLITPAPGHVEEDADARYGAVLRTIREVVEKSGAAPGEVAAIGMDGQMAGIMGVDGGFNADTPYDSWLDTRCGKYITLLRDGGDDVYIRLSGCPVTYAHAPKILWWKNERPEAYGLIEKFVMMNTYVAGRLAGLRARDAYIDFTQLHFAGFGDIQKLEWSRAMTGEYGVCPDKLPRIASPWETVGTLARGQAELCGLAAGIPVVAGCGDQPATSLGAGVLDPGDAFDVAGTASLFACCVGGYEPDVANRTLICARSIIEGRWLSQAYINGGGLSVRWCKELFENAMPAGGGVEGGSASSRTAGGAGYAALEAEAGAIPPGSNGLLFVPHFQGRVCPNDPDVRGSFAGLNWSHTRGHMFRAVMESIGYEYALYADILRACAGSDAGSGANAGAGSGANAGAGLGASAGSGPVIDKVIVIGGGAKSSVFNQIKSDILGLAYLPSARSDAPMLGCVINAGFGVGLYPDIAAATRKMTRFSDGIAPRPEYTREYAIYRQLYKEMLTALTGIYRRLPTV